MATAVAAGTPNLEDEDLTADAMPEDTWLQMARDLQGLEKALEEFDAVWDRLEDCGYFAFVDLDTDEDDERSEP